MKQSERLDIGIAVSLALILALACLPAHCKKKAKNLVDIEVPVQCVKKVLLIDCDAESNPPKCGKVRLDYRPASCAIVHSK